MSARSGQWDLLGVDRDPVPGLPEDIETEGRHYASVAGDIEDQVRRLRQLASDDEILKGQYAEALHESCEETADDLDKVHGRFEVVGTQLTNWWAPAVRTARDATGARLKDAEDAAARMAANESDGPRLPGAPEPTPEEIAADERRASSFGDAQGDLASARSRFDDAMHDFDQKARQVAKAIKDAADDDMKDSRWDGFKKWVSDHAKVLSLIADIISWVVTIVAVIALFCTPAGWVLLLIAGIALIGLGLRVALAMSGEGSWLDVVMDSIGILTLGTGRIAVGLAKLGRLATLKGLGRLAGTAARARVATSARAAFQNANLFAKPIVWLTRSNPLMRFLNGRAAYRSAYTAWVTKAVPDAGALRGVLAGMDTEIAGMADEIAYISSRFGSGAVSPLYNSGVNAARGLATTGALTDLTGKVLGDSFKDWGEVFGLGNEGVFGGYGGVDFFSDLKDSMTYELAEPPGILKPLFN